MIYLLSLVNITIVWVLYLAGYLTFDINILVSHKKNLKLETWKKQNLKYLSLNRDHVLDIHVCQSQICITIQNDSIRHIYKFSIYISPITWTLKRAHFRS